MVKKEAEEENSFGDEFESADPDELFDEDLASMRED